MMRLYLWVTFGGALGSAARFGISGLVVLEKIRVIHYRGDAAPGPGASGHTA